MDDKIIEFPLKAEISGPMAMDAEAFKANLAAAFLSGFELAKERAAKIANKHYQQWSNANGFEGHTAGAHVIRDEIRALTSSE